MATAKPVKVVPAAADTPKRRAAPSPDKILAVATELFAERGYAGVALSFGR